MKPKEEFVDCVYHSQDEWRKAVKELGKELRASRKRERDMWKALSKRCEFLCHTGNCDRDGIGKCTRQHCPLLKARAK